MRLDMDCVRDVLLCVEEHTGLRQCCIFMDMGLSDTAAFLDDKLSPKDYQIELLNRYDNDKLIYHVNYCLEANLISAMESSHSYYIIIGDLSPTGHEFLSNIRENKNWKAIKKIAGKVGSTSLSALTTIASEVITGLIKSELTIGL